MTLFFSHSLSKVLRFYATLLSLLPQAGLSGQSKTIKHFHLFSGFPSGWDSAYSVQLAVQGCKCFLAMAPAWKHPITPQMLLSMVPLFNLANPLCAAMWALFLVVFYSFFCKSNLVIDSPRVTSDKAPRRHDFVLTSDGAFLTIRASKTIHFSQRTLLIPLPFIPYSPLCPVSVLLYIIIFNSLSPSDFLVSVKASTSSPSRPLTYRHFSSFLSKVIALLQLDPHHCSPHSFRRGGASFAFECHVPAELIKFQGN